MTNSYHKYFSGSIIAILCGFLIFFVMQWGPWAYNDSSAYVSAARNINLGNGSVIHHSTGKMKQLTEFPPFYPAFLSIFGGSKGNYIQIIRLMNAILFALTNFLFFSILLELTGRHLFSVIFTTLFATFHIVIKSFTGAMSETLFTFLLFLGLYLLLRYLRSSHNRFLFFLFAITSALLPITRYAGILFAAVFGISLFVFGKSLPIKTRVLRTMGYLALSLSPIGIWAISLILKYQKFAGKIFSFSWSIFSSLSKSIIHVFNVVKLWLPYTSIYPQSIPINLLIFISTILVFGFLIYPFILSTNLKTELLDQTARMFIKVINLTIIGYVLLVAFMHTTSTPQIDIIDRTLMPLFPLLILSASFTLTNLYSRASHKNLYASIFFIISFLLLRFNLSISTVYCKDLAENGLGYTSKDFQESGLISEISQIAEKKIMISNLSGFVLFHTNRYPILIEIFPLYPFGSGDTYGEREFREEGAALIIFKSDFRNYYGENAELYYTALTKTLTVDYEDDEGVIFYY